MLLGADRGPKNGRSLPLDMVSKDMEINGVLKTGFL